MPKNRKSVPLAAMVLACALVGACMSERRETPTKGQVTVVCDESVMPLIQEEQKTFQDLYAEAHVTLLPATAREAIARMFNDSITIVVTSRNLNDEERSVAAKNNMHVAEYRIAWDGIAVIVHPGNGVDSLRTTQIDSILTGAIDRWSQVGSSLAGKIEIILPNRNTSTFEVGIPRLLKNRAVTIPATAVAADSKEMIDAVAAKPNAIGFVGLNWLNGRTDRVHALRLADPAAPDSLGKGQYFGPHQAYVYQQYYPLTRDIYILSRADNYGVAAGFTTFITSAPGQKIVLANGLVPATQPVRLVETTGRNLQ